MASFSKEFEFSTDENFEDQDENEQNFEREVQDMMDLWERDSLLKDVAYERDRLERNKGDFEDLYDGEEDFEKIQASMEPVNDRRQVFIKVTEPNPEGKPIRATNTILFDRIGYLEYELQPFESSIYDGKPIRLNLMDGPILPGLLQALISLREGEQADIMILPSMAFGPLGSPPSIPGDASLFYHVKIYKIWEESEFDELVHYERSNLDAVPIEQRLSLIEEHKNVANKYLKDDMAREAIIRYKAAINCIDEIPIHIVQQSQPLTKLLLILLQNCAIAFNKVGMFKSATKMAKRALFLNPKNLKALYQLAKARLGLSDHSGALRWIEEADKIDPSNTSFDQLRLEVSSHALHERAKRDEIMRNMSRAFK